VGMLKLLAQAQAAGLTVEAADGKLIIIGPKRAAAIARELGEHKAAVLLAPATGPSTRRSLTPTESNPATLNLNGEAFDVAITGGMWFFRRTAEAGWTCCSAEFVAAIEQTTIHARTT
jgi:hypothetical protein